jgi:hypothetical protein
MLDILFYLLLNTNDYHIILIISLMPISYYKTPVTIIQT